PATVPEGHEEGHVARQAGEHGAGDEPALTGDRVADGRPGGRRRRGAPAAWRGELGRDDIAAWDAHVREGASAPRVEERDRTHVGEAILRGEVAAEHPKMGHAGASWASVVTNARRDRT